MSKSTTPVVRPSVKQTHDAAAEALARAKVKATIEPPLLTSLKEEKQQEGERGREGKGMRRRSSSASANHSSRKCGRGLVTTHLQL